MVDQSGVDRTFRYQLDNRLGSVTVELDGEARVITWEEYYPYGCSSILWGSKTEVERKRYRYSGKELDRSTGLYYYGARYYAPWLGRWMTPDPAGTVDGLNLYAFVKGNPVTDLDLEGMGKEKNLTIHGKTVPKPETHQKMHKRTREIGEEIGAEPAGKKSKKSELEQLDKKLMTEQKSSSIQIYDEAILKKAIAAGLKGQKDTFSDYYRGARPYMDEHLSTVTMFETLAGIGSSSALREEIGLAVGIASRFRLPTSQSGYSTATGAVQHPTTQGDRQLQMKNREGIKRMINILIGQPDTKTQPMTAPWIPDRHRRSPSPRRV